MNIYSLFYNIVFIPIFFIIYQLASFFLPKLKDRNKNIKQSLSNLQKLAHNHPVVWFHAASMGEFEQAKPVIERLKQYNPSLQIVCTFFSPSGYNTQKNYEFADAVCYLPFDSKHNAMEFVNQIKPNLVVFVRYELWLNFISILKINNIPIFIINATYPNILKKHPQLSDFYKNLFNQFTNIYTVSEEHFNYFSRLNLNANLIRSADTRIDRIVEKVKEAKKTPIIPKNIFNKNNIILIAGSTWGIDENYLINAVNEANQQYNNIVTLIIVPHEPTKTHIDNLTKEAKNYILLSELHTVTKDIIKQKNPVIIVDSIGKLLKLYGNADIAYIGGAFGVGVHSLTEAAGYGLPLCAGPNCHNSHDSIYLEKSGALTVIHNQSELFRWIEKMITDKNSFRQAASDSLSYVNQTLGTSQIIASAILKFIE